MTARILPYQIALLTLVRELEYTLSQMNHEPLAAPHVPVFQGLREGFQPLLLEEITILSELASGQAAVNMADRFIDAFAGRVSHSVDEHTSDATRKQLRAALFKSKSLSRFRRPVLAGQLAAMADWNQTLAQCGVPALVALAPEAATVVGAGRAAEQQRAAAQQRNRDFRDVGARKQFIDRVNAARKEAHGALAKLPFEHPALPRDFADGFFYTDPPRDQELTIDQVKTAIEELEAELAERIALLARLEEEAAAAALAEEERRAHEQEADVLEAQAQALLAQVAALRAQGR
jgi:hypothetical protein